MQGPGDIAPLRLEDATLLAHALGATVAETLSIRVLSIKGPAADHHALRAPRISADADFLVEPAAFDRFCSALEHRGWHQRVARQAPTILEPHSRTYIHAEWPCDIDVHIRFPGFFAPSESVFDELWSRREAISVGNVSVSIPSLVGSSVIGALHALRNMSDPRHANEWHMIVDVLRHRLTTEQQFDVVRLAEAGRARWVLRDAIDAMGLGPVDNDLEKTELDMWTSNIRYGADGGAVGWIRALRKGTVSHRARMLAQAVWVPRALIPRNEAAVKLSTAQVIHYQADRWRRGLRAILRYLGR